MSLGELGINHLRRAVCLFNNTREDFNDTYHVVELLRIYDAWLRSGWDFTPDMWTPRQVGHALAGIAPRWDEQERPDYYSHKADRTNR